MPEVLGIGEAMVLLLAEQPGPLRDVSTFRRFIAGAEANVAVGLCRLGLHAGFVSRIGSDELGAAIRFRLRGEGVDTSQLKTDPGAPTGLVFRERREVGPVDVVYYRRGSAASRMTPADLDANYLANAQYVVLSGITPALSDSCKETVFAAAEIARSKRVKVVIDANIRLKLWSADEARSVLRDLIARADLVLAGAEEAELLTGQDDGASAAKELAKLGPAQIVVKLGARGALAYEASGISQVATTPLARVVDPVGAGDAFAAGFLAGQLRGLDLTASLALANRCGAYAMTLPGDQECLPFWDDVAEDRSIGVDVRR
jgi:2-dehydro-3-deoxygluconokinase